MSLTIERAALEKILELKLPKANTDGFTHGEMLWMQVVQEIGEIAREALKP